MSIAKRQFYKNKKPQGDEYWFYLAKDTDTGEVFVIRQSDYLVDGEESVGSGRSFVALFLTLKKTESDPGVQSLVLPASAPRTIPAMSNSEKIAVSASASLPNAPRGRVFKGEARRRSTSSTTARCPTPSSPSRRRP